MHPILYPNLNQAKGELDVAFTSPVVWNEPHRRLACARVKGWIVCRFTCFRQRQRTRFRHSRMFFSENIAGFGSRLPSPSAVAFAPHDTKQVNLSTYRHLETFTLRLRARKSAATNLPDRPLRARPTKTTCVRVLSTHKHRRTQLIRSSSRFTLITRLPTHAAAQTQRRPGPRHTN